MIISYSNNLEDVMLTRVFADIESGFYVDVGSYKALDHSNTAALYAKGWRGVACDPIYNFEQLWAVEWKRLRPRDIIIRDLIGEQPRGEADYFMCNYRGLSTGAPETIDRHTSLNGNQVVKINSSRVPTTTLTRVLDHGLNGNTLHLICIDVEGMEEQVLRGLDFGKYKPWVFVIEAVHSAGCTPSCEKWEPLLLEQGYTMMYNDRINRFYLHESQTALAPRFAFPPNVLDNYKTLREWELERRLSEYESDRPLLG